jgi:hypothetical protein
MNARSRIVPVMAAVAGLAFWLAIAGPGRLLGIDTGNVGVAMLLGGLWLSLWWLSRVPVETLQGTASPAEWQAWIGLGFLGMAIVYFLVKLPLFAAPGPLTDHPEVARAGRNGVMLLVGWFVLSSVLGRRWRERVQLDERDREIAARGCTWARGFLVAALFVLAVTLALTPPGRLEWATPVLLAQALILIAMVSHWIELAVQAASYRRDRR